MKKSVLVFLTLLSQASFGMNRESGGFKVPAAIFVNFASIGTGIDRETNKYVRELINEAKEKGLLDQLTSSGRGFEGDQLLCVRFKEMSGGPEFAKLVATAILKNKATNKHTITQILFGSSCEKPQEAKELDPNSILNPTPSRL